MPGYWQSVTGSKDTPDEPLEHRGARSEGRNRHRRCAPNHLRDWQLSNVYEIYPVWRHRYAPGVMTAIPSMSSACRCRAISRLTLSPREHLRCRLASVSRSGGQVFLAVECGSDLAVAAPGRTVHRRRQAALTGNRTRLHETAYRHLQHPQGHFLLRQPATRPCAQAGAVGAWKPTSCSCRKCRAGMT